MKLLKFGNLVLTGLLALCLFGCNNNAKPNVNLSDISSIVDDLPRDENGEFVIDYLEGVQLNMWSVIGQPDQDTLINLVKEFNKEYAGMIEIKVTSVGHYDYYNALDSTYANDYGNFPDVCFMHNEKNIEYALKGYFYPLDELINKVGVDINFDLAYDNIEKTTIYDNSHFGIPIDAHGYLNQIRQDIIKKNGLGFDGNTRFIPNTYEEYQSLLEDLRALADTGELWVRNINLDQDHSWYKLNDGNPKLDTAAVATKDNFYPAFFHSQEADNLTALYVNGGNLINDKDEIVFHKNQGMMKYVTDLVERFNTKLFGDAGNKEAAFPVGQITMFSEGPWMVANTYNVWWNSKQLKTAGKLGVTEEDANDPIYSNPYAVARSRWMADTSAPEDTKTKWYGNGHVITLTNKITSMQKAAAALIFAHWYTQETNSKGEHNLTTWCKAGHVPAWKNVYDSEDYKVALANSMTLQALGDPAEIIALESTRYATTLIAGLTTAVGNVSAALLSTEGCTTDKAKQLVDEVALSTQEAINLLKLGM